MRSGRWLLLLLAVVVLLLNGTASALAYALRSSSPAIPSSPLLHVAAESAYPVETLTFTLETPIGLFASGDPVNFLDPDGRLAKESVKLALDVETYSESIGMWNSASYTWNMGGAGNKALAGGAFALGGVAMAATFVDTSTSLIPAVGQIKGAIKTGAKSILKSGLESIGKSAIHDVDHLAAKEIAPLYHYTSPGNVAGILERGLVPGASGKVFTTPNGALTPLQAQIELALSPNRGLPGSLLKIDAAGLQKAGIKPSLGPLRVQPTKNSPGGGVETIFDQQIPPEFIQKVW